MSIWHIVRIWQLEWWEGLDYLSKFYSTICKMFFKKEWIKKHRPWASMETCPDEHRQARFMLLCIAQAQFSSVTQSCLTLCDSMDCSKSGFPVHHHLPEFAQTHVHPVRDAIQESHPLVPFSSCLQFFPASWSFPMSVFRIRWPKYCSFSFSISPFNEYSEVISFRTHWFDLLSVKGTLKVLI